MSSIVFAYRAVADTGLAPCVDNGLLSFACCIGGRKDGVKTGVRYWAGDALSKAQNANKEFSVYILGYLKGSLFYAAKIDEWQLMTEYYGCKGKSIGRLDNIYTIDKNGQLKRNSKHLGLHTDKDQQMRDISGTYVLLSRNFVYLGKDTDKNEELNGWCPKGRSAVRILNDVKLVDKIEAFIKGNQGTFHRSCHKLEQCCTC